MKDLTGRSANRTTCTKLAPGLPETSKPGGFRIGVSKPCGPQTKISKICYLSNIWPNNPYNLYAEAFMLNGCAAAGTGVGAPTPVLSMALTITAFTVKQGGNIKNMSPKGRSNRFAPPFNCGERYTLRSRPLRHRCRKSISFTRH